MWDGESLLDNAPIVVGVCYPKGDIRTGGLGEIGEIRTRGFGKLEEIRTEGIGKSEEIRTGGIRKLGKEDLGNWEIRGH